MQTITKEGTMYPINYDKVAQEKLDKFRTFVEWTTLIALNIIVAICAFALGFYYL